MSMNPALARYAPLIACLAIGFAAGTWSSYQGRARVADSAAGAPAVAAEMPGTPDHSVIEPVTASLAQGTRPGGPDDAWVKRGDALMQKARETLDAGYYDRAEAAFRKALALNPTSVSAMTSMAWVCGGRHEFEASSEWARKALALDPKQHAAYGLLGDAAMETGDYEAALEHFQKMLAIGPDISSYSRAARLMYLTGDTRKATWLMRKAIAAGAPHAENTAWCHAQLALMLWHTGALLPAEQALEGALKQSPDNFHLLAAMGQVKASRKEYRAAIQYYEKAVAVAPQHDALTALGDLYTLTGRKDEAEKQFQHVEQLLHTHAPGGTHGGMELARFFADHDRHLREALAMAEAEYKVHADVFGADTLAWCYFKNGRYLDAQKTIRKALRLGTPDARILFHAGMIAAKRGDRAGAQKYLYQALSLNPYFHPVDAATAADVLKRLGTRAPKNKPASKQDSSALNKPLLVEERPGEGLSLGVRFQIHRPPQPPFPRRGGVPAPAAHS